MNQRIVNYMLKLNEQDTLTYVTGPDGKVIADTGIARICKTVDQANAITQANIDMARRITACLNACDGMTIESLEAMPAGFNMLLSDGFKRAIEQPAITAMISDEQARDFIEKWNALPQTGGQLVPMQRFELMPPIEIEQIAWLQKVHTLHRQAEMLYVVDGYEVTITWDETPISEDFKGETLSEAISKAMAGFDLHVRHPYQDREKLYPQERQFIVLETQHAELVEALENLLEDDLYAEGEGPINIENKSEFAAAARAVLDKAKGVSV